MCAILVDQFSRNASLVEHTSLVETYFTSLVEKKTSLVESKFSILKTLAVTNYCYI